jgi:hypothetical protein
LFFGATVGITKFEQRSNFYFPVSASVIYSFLGERNWYPVVVVEPGYGYYSEKLLVNEQEVRISGGFSLAAGAGLEHMMESGGRIYLTAGLSRFAIGQVGAVSSHRRLSLKIGIRL